jgi:hypothetical protein
MAAEESTLPTARTAPQMQGLLTGFRGRMLAGCSGLGAVIGRGGMGIA